MSGPGPIINADTGLSVEVLWALLGAAVTVTLIAAGIFFRLNALVTIMHRITRNQWTLQDHLYWTKELEAANQDLSVPMPKKITDSHESVPSALGMDTK